MLRNLGSRIYIITPQQFAYQQYLKSEHWQGIRKEALKRARHRCEITGNKGLLDVHHLFYPHPWTNTTLHNVVVVARFVHKKIHELNLEPQGHRDNQIQAIKAAINPKKIKTPKLRLTKRLKRRQKKKNKARFHFPKPKISNWYNLNTKKYRLSSGSPRDGMPGWIPAMEA